MTAASVAVVTGLLGCSPVPQPSTVSLPDGVSVEFVQGRSDVAARQAQVQITNGTDGVLNVGPVAVTDPRFDGNAMRVLKHVGRIQPGTTVGVRVQLPDMACEEGASDEGESTVVFDFTLDDESGRASGDLPDPLAFLPGLHHRECLAAALAEAAELEFTSFTPSPSGEPADLVLRITPTGDGAASIDGIQTTNLLTFGKNAQDAADTYPIGVVASGDDITPTEAHLPLVPLRCDPHAVQEDKRGTIFTLEVQLDGVPQEIELAASEELRGEMLTWVADWCEFGEP